MDKPIQDALHVAKQAQKDINEILADPLHVNNRLTLNGYFDRIFKLLEMVGAVQLSASESAAAYPATKMFPPIKKFMGKEINRAPIVTDKTLNPRQAEINILRAKVDKLYNEFEAIGAAAILRSYTMPEDVRVVRGVAKRAGVPNFENAPLTQEFMNKISEGIKANEALKLIQQKLPTDSNDDGDDLNDDDEPPAVKISPDTTTNSTVIAPGDLIKGKGQTDIKGKK